VSNIVDTVERPGARVRVGEHRVVAALGQLDPLVVPEGGGGGDPMGE
jgi:hypothetical protein